MRTFRRVGALSAVAVVLGLAPVVAGPAAAAPGDTTLVSAGPLWDASGRAVAEPSVSDDGRYVAFTSGEPWGGTLTFRQVYVADRVSGTATLVSADPAGGEGDADSFAPRVSGDGRYVAFTSYASDLVPGAPATSTADVYRRDLLTGTTVRVSEAAGGGETDLGAGEPAISGDGRYVAFASAATNLADPPAGGKARVWRRDLATGDLVPADAPEGATAPAISADGRYLAFVAEGDVWRADLSYGGSQRVSVAYDGSAADGPSRAPAISADGRYVAFESDAANVVADDTNGATDVFVRDVLHHLTRRASVSDDGAQAPGGGTAPALAADGSAVAFVSAAALDGDGAPGAADVFLRDLRVPGTTLVSRPSGDTGTADAASAAPALDATGALAVFASAAGNLVPGDADGAADVFARERFDGARTSIAVAEPHSGWANEPARVRATLSASYGPVAWQQLRFVLRDAGGAPRADATATTDWQGVAEVWLPMPPDAGDYVLDVTYAGDAEHAPAARSQSFAVALRRAVVEYAGDTSGIRGEPARVAATLRDPDNGEQLANRQVTFELHDGATLRSSTYATTGWDGRAAALLDVPVDPGQYDLVARYAGEPGRSGALVTTPFSVGLWETALANAGDVTGYRGEQAWLRAVLTGAQHGEPIADRNVRFVLEHQDGTPVADATARTGPDGLATALVPITADPGDYVLRLLFAGDLSLGASVLALPFEVRLRGAELTYTGATTTFVDDQVWARAELTETEGGSRLPDRPVTFTLLDAADQPVAEVGVRTDANGVADAVFPPPPVAGSYTMRTSFAGDLSFAPALRSVPFEVRRHVARLDVLAPAQCYVDEWATVWATVTDAEGYGAPGGYTVDVVLRDGGTEVVRRTAAADPDGTVRTDVHLGVPAGSYTLSVEFAGTAAYGPAAWEAPLLVQRRAVEVAYLGPDAAVRGEWAEVAARVTMPDTSGPPPSREVRFELLDGGAVVAAASAWSDETGLAVASFEVTPEAGSYVLQTMVPGDARFAPAAVEVPFAVVLRQPSLTVSGDDSAQRGTWAHLVARLADDEGRLLAGRRVTFALERDGAVLASVAADTDANGYATTALEVTPEEGAYDLAVTFAGDVSHHPSRVVVPFTVRVHETALAYNGDTTGISGEPAWVGARLTDTVTGEPLGGRTVEATLRDGTDVLATATLTTDGTGQAYGPVDLDAPAGEYTLVVRYGGNAGERASEVSVSFTVTARPVTFTYGGATTGATGTDATLAARLVAAGTGAPLAGRTVTFAFAGETAVATTDADGVASVLVPLPAPGTYDVTASTPESRGYAGAALTLPFTVTRAPSSLAYDGAVTVVSGEPLALGARLVRADTGAPLAGRTVTFDVMSEGERHAALSAVTGADGRAAVTYVADLPAGTYTVAADFAGDALTDDAATTATADVTARPTTVVDESAASGVRGTDAEVAAVVTDTRTGAPLAGRGVTFRIGTRTATAETDANGRAAARIRLDLAPGTYDLVVTADGDDRRLAGTATRPFAVRWQYSFTDQGGAGTVHLNVVTREFQLAVPGDVSAIVHDPAMTVSYGVGGSIVEVNYSSPAITLVGTFQLATGRFNATARTARGYYTLRRV